MLLIEDSATDARLAQAALAHLRDPELEVEHAADLETGLVRIAQQGIDLVLLDLHLPGSDGVGTLLRVQALAPDLPVVVVTASDDEALVERVLGHGAADLVVKGAPHFVALLRHSVRAALERVQVLEALRQAAGVEARPPVAKAAVW